MHQGVLYRSEPQKEITREDVDKLIQDMYKIALPPGDQILHVIPQEFMVDEEEGVTDPIGMTGSRLQSNFHIKYFSSIQYHKMSGESRSNRFGNDVRASGICTIRFVK
jgi:cell division ATPase FtsA